jgi:lipopolysaccharide/colanic/teichoic acid biosynthesis glycosyltransferase
MESMHLEPFNPSVSSQGVAGPAALRAYAPAAPAPRRAGTTRTPEWRLEADGSPTRARVQQALAHLRAYGWQSISVPTAQRLVESAIAVVLLVLTAPILAVLCVMVSLDSPGPALFRQWRIGRGGRLFRFTKLRTLYVDARQRWPELYAYDYTPEQLEVLRFKVPDDPRVTRVGRWLRKSTLDELPNLWHVLTGEMALVGPRPEIPDMLPYYTDDTIRKFAVRPGVTGLAQVSGRGHLTFHETVACDIAYVDQCGFWTDARVLCLTLLRALQRHGAF